jgi:hypothetical protein
MIDLSHWSIVMDVCAASLFGIWALSKRQQAPASNPKWLAFRHAGNNPPSQFILQGEGETQDAYCAEMNKDAQCLRIGQPRRNDPAETQLQPCGWTELLFATTIPVLSPHVSLLLHLSRKNTRHQLESSTTL